MQLKMITASILAATLATGAFAQSTTATTNSNGAAGGTASATAQSGASADMNYGNVISQLQSDEGMSTDWATQLADIGADAKVNVITVDDLKGQAGDKAAALDNALQKDETKIASARTAIESNDTLNQALKDKDFTAKDVVGVTMDKSTNDVTLIVKKSS